MKIILKLPLLILGYLMLALPAQAASFDCGKAQSKIEKMICADAELSRLDEEIAKLYSEVFKKSPDETMLKKRQREWLKARNLCGDVPCLHRYYQGRIAELKEVNAFKNEESYTLLMSKDDEFCKHMMELFNQDLKKYGWRGDEHQEEHEEFKRIPWEPARFSSVINGRVEYTDVEGALFDFNNDGVQDFVVRWQSSLSNARADLLVMLDSEMVKRRTDLASSELWNAVNQIDIAGSVYHFSAPLAGVAEGLWVLSPFRYRNTSYLLMRPIFEIRRTMTGYAAITKYDGGKFVNREMTGKMEDVCYYQRNRAKHIH
jgi:uncharacterized protein